MNANKSFEEILMLFENNLPEAKKQRLISDLNQNEEMRRHFISHVFFKKMIKMSTARGLYFNETSGSHVDDETLGAFLEVGLENEEEEKIKAHIRECPQCFQPMAELQKAIKDRENLVFSKTPANFIEKAKQLKFKPEKIAVEAKYPSLSHPPILWKFIQGFAEKIKKWFEPIPAWGFGLAIAVIALIIFLWPASPIKNISLENQLVIFETSPLGFVTEREVIEYKGMTVELDKDDKNLIFKWSEIQDALYYEICLIENGEKRMITSLGGVMKNSFSFPKQKVKVGVKYIWELSGKLKNDGGFRAKSGFVCKK